MGIIIVVFKQSNSYSSLCSSLSESQGSCLFTHPLRSSHYICIDLKEIQQEVLLDYNPLHYHHIVIMTGLITYIPKMAVTKLKNDLAS